MNTDIFYTVQEIGLERHLRAYADLDLKAQKTAASYFQCGTNPGKLDMYQLFYDQIVLPAHIHHLIDDATFEIWQTLVFDRKPVNQIVYFYTQVLLYCLEWAYQKISILEKGR
jgi:hypothetical protein